jgi:molybdate/tungstate transport system substrate-binding protein
MVYGVTIPADAPNRAAAEAYVALLLSPQGQDILERNGQPCLRPAVCAERDALPPALAERVR